MTTYAIRGGEEGARRLDLLAQVMGPTTEALLATAGVRPGMTCLDLGCGAGHVSRSLGRAVGPTGRVVGLDFDAVKLAKAREECAGARLGNVEFRALDVRDWSEVATYDVAYGRFILSHLADPSAMLARMCAALRPNGLLILEDIDFTGAFCYPPSDAFDRYCELYRALIRRRDGDADLGARLYRMCLDAGLNDVLVQLVQPVHGGVGAAKGLTLSTMVNIADGAVAEGLATSAEVETLIAALTAYTEDARSIVACPRIFQVWGRRPLTPART